MRCACTMLAVAAAAAGATITSGNLEAVIHDVHGGPVSVVFNGVDFYGRAGGPVDTWGFQRGTDIDSHTAAFYGRVGEVTGSTPATVTVSKVDVPSTRRGPNIDYTRTYSVLNGNLLRVSTTFTSLDSGSLLVRLYDTFRPEPNLAGDGLDNVNDVFRLNGYLAGQATDTNSVVYGSRDPHAVISFGSRSMVPFGGIVNTGERLNAAFADPLDPDGTVTGGGVMIGVERLLGPGESYTFVYDHAFGGSAAEARAAFLAANPPMAAIPEPATVSTLAAGLAALMLGKRISRRSDSTAPAEKPE